MIVTETSPMLLSIIRRHASSETLKLPVFPDVVVELQDKLAEDNASIDEIAKIICKDQALASQALKMANSAFFSGLSKVSTIHDVIMRLGLRQVFNFLVVVSQKGFYKSRTDSIDKSLKLLWQHALATAAGTQWLMQKLGYHELSDEGFLAGLLHDIGKLLLLRVVEIISSENESMSFSEGFIAEMLASMHVEEGYRLMVAWSIPPVYCNVVRDHHKEAFDTANIILMSVRTVNQVCRKVGLSLSPERRVVPTLLPEVQALDINESILAELETVMKSAVEEDHD